MSSVANPKLDDPYLPSSLIPGVTGGVTGFFVWKKHPFLGFLAGEAMGMNAARIVRNRSIDHPRAFSNLGVASSIISGSLVGGNSRWRAPFWGGVAGWVVGVVATSFVKGSNAHMLRRRLGL